MFIRELVTQERNIPSSCVVVKKTYVGPLGTARYLLQSEEEINIDEAIPYKVVLLTPLLNNYNISHYLEMLKFFFVKTINCEPDNFIINKFASTQTTHIYPTCKNIDPSGLIYRDEFFYVCKEEAAILELNPINLLGLYPISNDPLCWFNMKVPDSIFWDDLCLIRSSSKTTEMEGAYETISSAIRNRHDGYKPEQDPPVILYNRT
jgi:hypothetical protein